MTRKAPDRSNRPSEKRDVVDAEIIGLVEAAVSLVRRIVREEIERSNAERDDASVYITVKNYAQKHSISRSTVKAAIKDGRLPVTRIGRSVRILASALIRPRDRSAEELDEVTLKVERKLGLR